MKKQSVAKSSNARTGQAIWWGIHYDEHGLERERRSFETRKEAREWVRAMKAKERGDLREKVA